MVKSSILDFNQRLTTSCPPWSGGNTKGGNPKVHSKYQRVKSSNLLILFSPQKSYKRRGFQNKSTNYSLTLTAVITTTITATMTSWFPFQVTSMRKEAMMPIKACALPPLNVWLVKMAAGWCVDVFTVSRMDVKLGIRSPGIRLWMIKITRCPLWRVGELLLALWINYKFLF